MIEEAGKTISETSTLYSGSTLADRVGASLPFTSDLHATIHRWLVEEAYTLDQQRYEDWLDTLTEDIHYVMPVRVTTALGTPFSISPGMAHWDDNKYSLSRRVARFLTEHAWTEDPPSRLRHYVTNVRVFETDVPGEVLADSAVLLFRSRGDMNEPSIISAHREDVFRDVDGEYKLARRVIMVDESVLRTQNLAIFL
ncbi:3-phenylpropionate/cinnamic acid dioxygenase subunit beta [Microbacterium sp. PAMC21962]|jgi:phthalate 3,4-dioxygenase subunit beta|uniref:3-phenylpropionate/cinnamic acid dioxygenase subunit beta n=1 Tax=Microbacterium sp. PAMC21962 TaxID=2861280 RepID=UPI001C630C6C|nr:3-phenylpropionate/cinnamic acid dioxygenase subunit beta [Microbacterium sp. PAMC21962]QYF97101.1 3-phenylpropionate/cinnamic acid dioxygenase subunit beta [Microbacterium sp. PAMC21962]